MTPGPNMAAPMLLHWVKLKFNTLNRELLEAARQSGKFRATWHHGAGGRGASQDAGGGARTEAARMVLGEPMEEGKLPLP